MCTAVGAGPRAVRVTPGGPGRRLEQLQGTRHGLPSTSHQTLGEQAWGVGWGRLWRATVTGPVCPGDCSTDTYHGIHVRMLRVGEEKGVLPSRFL